MMKTVTRFLKLALPFCLTSTLVFFTCNEEPTKPPASSPTTEYSLRLKEEYTSLNEIALHISNRKRGGATYFELQRDGVPVISGSFSAQDTLLVDYSVRPSRSYRYQAYRLLNNTTVDSSLPLIIKTLDTTRARYEWRIFDVGDYATQLNDVAIVNDTDIWVVGDITKPNNDSLFNAVHWNGKEWEVKRIEWYYQGTYGVSDLNSVYAANANDIWAANSAPYHFNGRVWENNLVQKGWNFNGYVYKIWGKDGYVFFCGENGAMVVWDGKKFSSMQTGTTIPLTDIYGTSTSNIYASGYDWNSDEGIVLHYDGFAWKTFIRIKAILVDLATLFKTHLLGCCPSIWIDETNTLYVLSSYLYKYKNGIWKFATEIPDNGLNVPIDDRGFLWVIRGTRSNNFFMAGFLGSLMYCNGSTSIQVGVPFSSSSKIQWDDLSVRDNVVCVVGTQRFSFLDKGIIALGIKQ